MRCVAQSVQKSRLRKREGGKGEREGGRMGGREGTRDGEEGGGRKGGISYWLLARPP